VVLIACSRPNQTIYQLEQLLKIPNLKIFLSVDYSLNSDTLIRYVSNLDKNVVRERILYHFHKQNLGLTKHIVSALESAFKKYKYAVILEDDIVFEIKSIEAVINAIEKFGQCSDFGAISMFSPIHGKGFSYLMLRQNYWRKTDYFACWGWATCRNIWGKYSHTLTREFEDALADSIKFNSLSKFAKKVWKGRFHKVKAFPLRTWDFQFQHLLFRENLNVYAPVFTLSGNNGFGDSYATNTKCDRPRWVSKEIPTSTYPENIIKSRLINYLLLQIDKFTFSSDNRISQLFMRLKKIYNVNKNSFH
jgi:hypothetical protein